MVQPDDDDETDPSRNGENGHVDKRQHSEHSQRIIPPSNTLQNPNVRIWPSPELESIADESYLPPPSIALQSRLTEMGLGIDFQLVNHDFASTSDPRSIRDETP